MGNIGNVSAFNINGNQITVEDAAAREVVNEIISAIGANNSNIAERINNLHKRSFDYTLEITSNDESEIASIQDGIYKLHYVTVTGSGDNEIRTLNNSAILIQKENTQYLYKDGKILGRTKTNNSWGEWQSQETPHKLSSNYETSSGENAELFLEGEDTYEEAFGKIEKAVLDNEKNTTQSLIELNSKINNVPIYDSSNKLSADFIENGETNKVINIKPNWNAAAGSDSEILNKPTLSTVAKSGSYNDLSDKPTIGISDDVVQVNWGGSWRMPTTAELQALGNAVNTTWTADYQGSGVAGLVCTDKTDSSKTLFFPAAGYCHNGSVDFVGNVGFYWSSSLYTGSPQSAFSLNFYGGGANWGYNDGRCSGFAVRGILDGPFANGHEYVEIGGIKWATMNVGANSIIDTGLYFQWGDTQGYTTEQVGSGEGQKYFGWTDYKYGNGTNSPGAAGMTKYNATDGLTILETSEPISSLHKVAVSGSYNDLSDKPTSMSASDVYSWAKTESKPTYTWSEIINKPINQSLLNQFYLGYVAAHPEDCYFTYIALGNGTCHLANSDYCYSKDLGSNWVHVTSAATEINVANGDIVLFKGTIMPQAYVGIGQFKSSAFYEVAGNIMSFLYGDSFRRQTSWPFEMPDNSGFFAMFIDETTLKSAKNLILPITMISEYHYITMFRNCTLLIESPIIGANSINNGGAANMFDGCSNLRYINTKFKTLASASGSLYEWVKGVASKGIFIKNVAAEWDISGVSGVPEGWQIQYTYDTNYEENY